LKKISHHIVYYGITASGARVAVESLLELTVSYDIVAVRQVRCMQSFIEQCFPVTAQRCMRLEPLLPERHDIVIHGSLLLTSFDELAMFRRVI
jgi:hypothetical protein